MARWKLYAIQVLYRNNHVNIIKNWIFNIISDVYNVLINNKTILNILTLNRTIECKKKGKPRLTAEILLAIVLILNIEIFLGVLIKK